MRSRPPPSGTYRWSLLRSSMKVVNRRPCILFAFMPSANPYIEASVCVCARMRNRPVHFRSVVGEKIMPRAAAALLLALLGASVAEGVRRRARGAVACDAERSSRCCGDGVCEGTHTHAHARKHARTHTRACMSAHEGARARLYTLTRCACARAKVLRTRAAAWPTARASPRMRAAVSVICTPE